MDLNFLNQSVPTLRTVWFLLWLPVLSIAGENGTRIPDLTQTDPKGKFARGGKSYCAPVAVSNSLMCLYGKELDRLGISQYDLVNQLASDRYMKTDPVKGTGPSGVMIGVSEFLKTRGLGEADYTIQFQGWRTHRSEFSTGVKEPQLEWIRDTLASGGAVWLNLGWYRRDESKNTYERIGGHWVTAIEAGRDHNGQPDPTIVVIHDPAPRAGGKPRPQSVKMDLLESGQLIGKTRNLPRPASGLCRIAGEMVIKSSADCAILDGVVALRFTRER